MGVLERREPRGMVAQLQAAHDAAGGHGRFIRPDFYAVRPGRLVPVLVDLVITSPLAHHGGGSLLEPGSAVAAAERRKHAAYGRSPWQQQDPVPLLVPFAGSVFGEIGAEAWRWVDELLRDAQEQGLLSRGVAGFCLLYTSPSPRDKRQSRMPSSA